jgi:integrase
MAYRGIAALMEKIRADLGIASRALEVCILTATRTGEILGAKWSEITWQEKVWTIPAPRMKAAREPQGPAFGQRHDRPREPVEVAHLRFVFPSPRGKHPLSHVAMARVLARLGVIGATVHGFRSAFRDWAGNETNFPREVGRSWRHGLDTVSLERRATT